ncbi:Hvo_1808 family surface protein [Haladaptatus salinisoli]|uniref:Hvo_1808 family surface protein n=1 Tax=Haladaptatus salinisoli TaxID=2884876 RepID=UPI001D0A0945|nr:Hvo_1808 family surface protein [Haladaptatus salinisoli]
MRGVGVVVVVLLVCVAPAVCVTDSAAGERGNVGPPPDPDSDVLGWENGYWHNESIAVDQSDGLTDAELRAYVGRAMARVEFIREEEFARNVTVESLPRERFSRIVRSQLRAQSTPAQRAWENQIWEAMFVTDEPTDAVRERTRLSQERIAGFYLPGEDEIFVISDGELVVDNATLIHELTHALQDQRGDLNTSQFEAQTMDGQRGLQGLTEGEASYVEKRYVQRCGAEWECVETPGPEPRRTPYGGGPLPPYNLAMQVATIQPYSDGPAYVASIVESDGWDAVEREYGNPPKSSEQVIDPETRNAPPASLRLDGRARNGWRLYGEKGENGSETVGEAGIYAMFWYQGRVYDNPVIRWREFEDPEAGEFDVFNYTSEPSDGWANDRLWPYHKGDERGYVWRTKWDSSADATEFARAYRDLLRGQNATRVAPGTWVIEGGGFADAFRIVRDGRTVTIVNGPTIADLGEIRPSSGADARRSSSLRENR